MRRLSLVTAALLVAAVAGGSAGEAAVLTFSGSMTGLGVSGPDASCAPLPFRGTISPDVTVGHSSLGDFTYSHNICLSGPSGPSRGTFAIDFGGDGIEGTMDGGATPTATPGVANVSWVYTILGGTGRFIDAFGSFTGGGTSDARSRPTQVALTFNGLIEAPAIPEPAAWAMMLVGFGLIGGAVRLRRAEAAPAV